MKFWLDSGGTCVPPEYSALYRTHVPTLLKARRTPWKREQKEFKGLGLKSAVSQT